MERLIVAVVVTAAIFSNSVTWALEERPQTLDVLEGENVRLDCRFSPNLSADRPSTLFWIRTNRNGHDNVAIGGTPYEKSYTVTLDNQLGRYDLHIVNATYDRDNGAFECRMKESGTGETMHSKSVQLTVLLKPAIPEIHPAAPSATEGRPLNLTCSSVGGSPPPQIHWYRQGETQSLDALIVKGSNKDEPTSAILTINPSKEDDGTTYRCGVWNRALGQRQMFEAGTKVDVNYFPRLDVGPENPLRVERDETAELRCTVDAKPAVNSVKWTRNGRFIDTNFKHTIPRVTLQDSGSYICSADNGLGQVGKEELKLDVLYAPVVTVPGRREIREGEDVAVDCQVSANPRPTKIEWFKEGDATFSQNGPSLRLKSVSADDNGRYVCTASNYIHPTGRPRVLRTGNASIEINIRHRPGKTFIRPEDGVAVEGKPMKLTCGAKPPGYPTPTYRWWKAGTDTTLAIGADFVIQEARLSHAGEYMCQPTNELGDGTKASVALEVYQPPKIITQLQPTIMKRAGDTGFHITCSAVGKPKPKVRWFKDGQEIIDTESNMFQISTSEQETIPNMAYNVLSTLKYVGPDRIQAKQLMPTDRGHYTCQFENEVSRTETTMLLRIEHSPVVVHQHNKVAFDIGETAYISCKMQAFPSPRFDWSFENNILQSDRHFYEQNMTVIGDDIFEGLLKINNVVQTTYGDYICKGVNSMGAKRTIIKLQPKGQPEQPENLRPINSGYNFITIAWDDGFDGGYNTSFTIQYRREGDSVPGYHDCGGFNPCNLTGLDQHSQYHIKIKASNLRGESKFSEEIVAVTKVDVNQIPMPLNVVFEKSTKIASFNVLNNALALIAKVELENQDGTWQHYNDLFLSASREGELLVDTPLNALRVRLCLQTNDLLCGPYAEAVAVDVRPNTAASAFGEPWVIALVVCIVVLALLAMLLAIKCCCRRTSKKSLKPDEPRPSIVHSNQTAYNAFDNKVDKDSSGEELKANIYSSQNGYGYPTTTVTPYTTTVDQQSNSNSNSANGGSVNSQDSLWNVKNGEPYHQQTGYYAPQPPQYDPLMHPQHFEGNGDYTHYPYPEEYIGNRQYIAANGDAYAAVTKQPRQQRIESEYSAYGDVSGLPDPYHDHPDHGQQHDPQQQQHQQQPMSFEDSVAESGYSTPNSRNRRIIREIIV